MGQDLYWRPERDWKPLKHGGRALADAFRDRNQITISDDHDVVAALAKAHIEGARELLELLEKHETLELIVQ